MIDGLKQEQFSGSLVLADWISGANINVTDVTATTATLPTIVANTALTALDTLKAGSHVLSSGSRWVTFGTAFSNNLYHVTCSAYDVAIAMRGEIGTGSHAPGSFVAVGSPTATHVFDWVAVRRSS